MVGDTVSKEKVVSDYRKYTRRKVAFILICLTLSIIAIGASVTVGGRDLSVIDVYETIFNHLMGHEYEMYSVEWMDDVIVWNVRLPRALFAIIAGAGLAVSGAAMQSVLKNPLADPYTTGISSGACFGVAVACVFGLGVMNGGFNSMSVILSFVFSLVPMLVVMLIAPRESVSPATLILAGVAMSYLFNSLTSILLTFTDSETLATIYEWQIGSLRNIGWDTLYIPFILTICGTILLTLISRKLNVLSLGDKQATGLGIDVEVLRIVLLAVCSLIVAGIIAYAGIIGFIGLVSPHIVRMVIDSDNRFVIPAAALFGASFLLICDMISRWISPSEAIPLGVVVSCVGAPIFLYLIIRQRTSMW